MSNFINAEYEKGLTDVINDIFYCNTSYRGKIGFIRVLTEYLVRKLTDYPSSDKMMLGYDRVKNMIADLPYGTHIQECVDKIKNDKVFGGPVTLEPLHTEPAGICPECGAPVVETARAFGCSGWKKGCKFAIWKDDRFITSLGKKVSYEMVKILLEHGKVGFRGCVSKRGNKFSAYFYYEKDEKTGRYNWRLEFIDTNPPQA